MGGLIGPSAAARFLLTVGYSREQIVATLRQRYPAEDADALYDKAADERARDIARLDQMIEEEKRYG